MCNPGVCQHLPSSSLLSIPFTQFLTVSALRGNVLRGLCPWPATRQRKAVSTFREQVRLFFTAIQLLLYPAEYLVARPMVFSQKRCSRVTELSYHSTARVCGGLNDKCLP